MFKKIRDKFRSKNSASLAISAKDLWEESLNGVGAKPSRLAITMVGTVLGIASLVATIGFAQTAGGQIAKQFDALAQTRVSVEPATHKTANGKQVQTAVIPWDAVSRVSELAGVKSSALIVEAEAGVSVQAVQVTDPQQSAQVAPTVVGSSAGLLKTVDGKISTGRFFDTGHEERADRVAVLGKNAAQTLGINRVSGQPAIFIADRAYTVIGILESVGTREALLNSVIIPATTAKDELGLSTPKAFDIQIELGAGEVVGRQAPIALSPNNPDGFKVTKPADANELQQSIQADVNLLFVAIGVVALLGGGVGITNVMLLAVAERRTEIGLRRALGARSKDIAKQFILESLTTGVLGGLIGAAVGLFGLLIVCFTQQWTPVITAWAIPGGVLVGGLVGLISGTYPAIKAAKMEPVDALR